MAACERVIALDDGMPRIGYSGIEFATGSIGHGLAPIQYKIDVPPDATGVRVRIRRLTAAGRYSLHARVGRPIFVRPAARPSIRSDGELGEASSHLIDDLSVPPLPRCATLHLGVEVTDLNTAGQSLYEISAELMRTGGPAVCPDPPDAGPLPMPDAGPLPDAGSPPPPPPAGTPGGGGCGCAGAGGSPRAPGIPAVAVMIVAALALVRRRPWRRRAVGLM
jgi:MYXO-CTERM domain-containing protein